MNNSYLSASQDRKYIYVYIYNMSGHRGIFQETNSIWKMISHYTHSKPSCTLQLKSKKGKDGLDFLIYQLGKTLYSLSQLGKMSPKPRAKCESEVFLSRDKKKVWLEHLYSFFFLKKKLISNRYIYSNMYVLIYSSIYFFIFEKQPRKLCTYH